MDFVSVRITPIDNPSLAAFDSFSGAGVTTVSGDNAILRRAKRPRGRPKGSKNKPKIVPPPPETRFLNSTVVGIPNGEPLPPPFETRFLNATAAIEIPTGEPSGNATATVEIPAGEPSGNDHILLPVKRPVGRPKGSKNKSKTVSPPLETRFLNSTAAVEVPAGEPTVNNHVLGQVKRPVGRPKGSKNKPKTVSPPLEIRFLNPTAAVEVPAGESTVNNHVLGRVKRPVGRPKGSKNKPKIVQPPPPPPPLIEINSEIDIEIPSGADVVQWLLEFCRYYQVSLKVLNASGQLSNIIPYHHPSSVILGPFVILSLSGIVMWTTNSEETIFPLEVSLSSPDGVACSGTVGRSATAASMVKVVAITMTAETDCYNPPNNSSVETASISNAPPQTPNLLFNEFYESINPNDPIEDGMQLYDNLKEKYEEERDRMMKETNNDELMIDEDIRRCEENLTPALRVEPYRF